MINLIMHLCLTLLVKEHWYYSYPVARVHAKPLRMHTSIGGASRDRTDDPLLAKQVLSQLSYGPIT